MKRFLLAFIFTATAVCAETSFPGIKAIMSPADFEKAGLNTLSADQLEVLNSAIVKHYVGTVETAVAQQANQIAQETITQHEKQTILQRFGLPDLSFSQDWKELPGISGTVTNWVGSNSFKLDNGQIWEGQEPIPFELVNRKISIMPRPNGQFAIEMDGKSTTIRVKRLQ